MRRWASYPVSVYFSEQLQTLIPYSLGDVAENYSAHQEEYRDQHTGKDTAVAAAAAAATTA